MRNTRRFGGGLAVAFAIALGAATSVWPTVHAGAPQPRSVAAVAQMAVDVSGARLAETRNHAPLIAWSE